MVTRGCSSNEITAKNNPDTHYYTVSVTMSSCSHLVWLVLLVVIPAATGLPNGAPRGACVTMSPKHNNTNVQPSKSPYSLVVESVDKEAKTRKGGIYLIRSFDKKLVYVQCCIYVWCYSDLHKCSAVILCYIKNARHKINENDR